MKKEKEVVLIREGGLIVSVTNDVVTFGLMALAFWFNQEYVGGSHWFSAIIAICFFVSVMAAGGGKTRSFSSLEDAIAFLQRLKAGAGNA